MNKKFTVKENITMDFNWKKSGIFAAGVLFGTAGIKILSSRDAKKFYTNCTAAVLRAKNSIMHTATVVQENAQDIYAEAVQINEDREKEDADKVYDDAEAVEDTEAAEETSTEA